MPTSSLKELVAARGHQKGTLTRLFNFAKSNDIFTSSTEALLIKKTRLLESFQQYESLNIKISSIAPDDGENVEEIEDKYYAVLTALNEQLASTEYYSLASKSASPAHKSPAPQSQARLPSIELPVFTGKLTDYIPFINLFNSLIHENSAIDSVQKLYYLRTYLRNEPLDIIKNLPLTPESYNQALSLLNNRYNNKQKITNEHINALIDLKPMPKSTASNLREFISRIRQELAALTNLEPNVKHWDTILLCLLSRKLDMYTGRAYQLERNSDEEPTLQDFLSFLEKRALALENAEPGFGQHRQQRETTWSGNAVAAHPATQETCPFCKSNHKLYLCKTFQLQPVSARALFIKQHGLCTTCLGVHKQKCRYHFRCGVCKKEHHTLLHRDTKNDIPQAASATSLSASNNFHNDVLLPTAKVKILARDGTELHFKALIDSGSQLSFISDKAVQLLHLKPTDNYVNVVGITNSSKGIKRCVPIEIHSLCTPYKISTTCHVVEKITCDLPQKSFDVRGFNIPPHIKLADDDFNHSSEIDLLMGADCFFQILLPAESAYSSTPVAATPQPETLQTGACGPRLINTQFGYIIGGTLPDTYSSNFCNKVALKCITCDSDISDTLTNFWKTESVPETFNEKSSEQELCEYIFTKNVQLKDNKFEVTLPLKLPLSQINDTLGNSFHFALKRFLNLEKKLHSDPNLFSEYQKFIHDYLNLNHGHYVDIELYDLNKQAVYFLPHHAVLKPESKTTKLRTVFDASMKTDKKISLNDLLLNGPIVQRDIFDILLLFRIGDFTFTTDIKQMFRNVRLSPEYTSLQNILWRDSPDQPIKCIRLDTVTYGLKSSSYLATRCLAELAVQNERNMPEASFILKNCTYVDDVLYSSNDLEGILRAKSQLQQLLQMGSFHTHKWSSNNSKILHDIPSTEQHFDDIELQSKDYSLKTLGLQLVVQEDKFKITCPEPFNKNNITKRDILAYIGKFYDPLGFVSPIIVQAKAIMQKLWVSNTDWNSTPDVNIQREWLEFISSLASMEPIYIDRNIHVSNTDVVELIGFSDASSSTAYGCCVYLRVTRPTGEIKMHLLCSKSRINPLQNKNTTVPRLELNAALLLSTLVLKVRDTLKLKLNISGTYLFTDSKIVLAWLQTEPIKLKAYIANRVNVILKNTADFQWLYVNTKDNPADYVSRGVHPHELGSSSMWWHGPQFLCESEYNFNSYTDLPADIPETKPETAFSSNKVTTTTGEHVGFWERIHKYSNIHTMIRVLAYILRFTNCLKGSKHSQTFLTSRELSTSLLLLIKAEQDRYFEEEMACLRNNKCVKGALQSLHPFIDDKGIMRVGGRLHHSNISFSQKHQIILPKESHVTNCIIRSEHERLLHAGPKLLLSNLNQKYWIVNGLLHVKKFTNKCIICFRQKATASKQLMGSLPAGRVTSMSHPFEVTGVDYAGPINVKLSRIRRSVTGKGYICVFVCFATKAIHLELASDLTTETYLACLRRFISRRGLPKQIYSDNASTFKGARSQLTELYDLQSSQDHQSKVQYFTAQHGVDFHFIPSYSPTFGGLWEAAVKSTKHHLKRTLQSQLLTYEQINTVLVEIECVLNSRPLIPLSSSDVNDYSYLTPGHFLIGSALTMYPENDVSNTPQNRLKYWKLCTQLKQSFWKMWYKQYLNVLQNRPKWLNVTPNVKVDSLVILKEDNVPTMCWPLARIVKLYPGHDGHVRAVEVKTANGKSHVRSITKICVLPLE